MPLMWISISFIAGIIFASLFAVSAYVWLGIGLAILFVFVLFRLTRLSDNPISKFFARSVHPLSFILIISFLFGAWWYQFRQPNIDPFHVAFYNDRDYEMLVTGTLAEPPDYRDTYTNLQLKVEAVDSGSGNMPAKGLLLARVPALTTYEYGQRVRVRGDLKTPPENEEFSYRDYLARENIHSYMSIADVTVLPGNEGNPIICADLQTKSKAAGKYLSFISRPRSVPAGGHFARRGYRHDA